MDLLDAVDEPDESDEPSFFEELDEPSFLDELSDLPDDFPSDAAPSEEEAFALDESLDLRA